MLALARAIGHRDIRNLMVVQSESGEYFAPHEVSAFLCNFAAALANAIILTNRHFKNLAGEHYV